MSHKNKPLTPVLISAFDLDDAWFKCLKEIL